MLNVNILIGFNGLKDVELNISSDRANGEKSLEDNVNDDNKEDYDSDDEQADESKQLSNNYFTKGVQNKGFIDVWWLFDDGGKR